MGTSSSARYATFSGLLLRIMTELTSQWAHFVAAAERHIQWLPILHHTPLIQVAPSSALYELTSQWERPVCRRRRSYSVAPSSALYGTHIQWLNFVARNSNWCQHSVWRNSNCLKYASLDEGAQCSGGLAKL